MPQPDAALTAESLALIQAQAQARQEIVDLTQASVRAEVLAFTAWYSSPDITSLAGRLAKLSRVGQKQTAASTAAFSRRILQVLTGKRASATPITVDRLWGGVSLESVYGRLADQYRWLEATRGPSATPEARISEITGKPLAPLTDQQVLERIVQRAEIQSETAQMLAFRQQWTSTVDGVATVTGYRRVIHPELGGDVCGLCVAASTAVYRKQELLPIHQRCRCTVMPIVGDPLGPGDPGAPINATDLASIYEAAGGSTKAGDLLKTKFRIEEHGELGAVLVAASDAFRGPKQVASS